MTRQYPRPPFHGWPVQFWDAETETFAWYARPATFITQTQQSVATLRHAELVGRAMDAVIARFAGEIGAEGGLLVIHDWRSVRVYDREARRFYGKRIETYSANTLRGSVLVTNHSPLVRALLQLAALAVPLKTGVNVEFVDDPAPILASHRVTPLGANPFIGLLEASEVVR